MSKHSPLLTKIAEAALRLTDVRDADLQGDFLAMTRPQLADRIWVDALPELARDIWEHWHRERGREQLHAELRELAGVGVPSHADVDAMRSWGQSHKPGGLEEIPAEMKTLLDSIAHKAEEFGRAVETVVEEVGAGRPFTLLAALKLYLTDVPGTIRLVWRRGDDPSGTTIPSAFKLESAADLARLLPGGAGPPRVPAGLSASLAAGPGLAPLCAACSADGRQVLSGATDGTIRLWDLATNESLCVLEGHKGFVWTVALSRDGRRALSGGADRTVRFWDLAAGRQLRCFEGHARDVWKVAFSPDGLKALSADAPPMLSEPAFAEMNTFLTGGQTVTVTSIGGGGAKPVVRPFYIEGDSDGEGSEELRQFLRETTEGCSPALESFGQVPPETMDASVRAWDLASGQEMGCLDCLPLPAPVFGQEGEVILFVDPVRYLRRWPVTAGGEARALALPELPGMALAFSPDGGLALLVGSGGASIWDLKGHRQRCTLDDPQFQPTVASFAPDGSRLITLHNKYLRLWDAGTGKEQARFYADPGGAGTVSISPDGRRAFSACGLTDAVSVWDLTRVPRWTARIAMQPVADSMGMEVPGNLRSLAFSPDSRHLFTGGDDGQVRRWNVNTGQELDCFVMSKIAYSLAVLPNGRHFLAGCAEDFGSETSGSLHVWDAQEKRELRQLGMQGRAVLTVAISPDGCLAFCASSTRGEGADFSLWNLATGEELRRWQGPPAQVFSPAAFSPDGTFLLAGGAGLLGLWEVATGELRQTFGGHQGDTLAVGFAADRRQVLSGANDGTVRRWDLDTGYELQRFYVGPSSAKVQARSNPMGYVPVGDEVYSLALSGDGRQALSGCLHGTLRLWDLETERELCNLPAQSGWGQLGEPFMKLAIAPGGRHAASLAMNTVWLWELPAS